MKLKFEDIFIFVALLSAFLILCASVGCAGIQAQPWVSESGHHFRQCHYPVKVIIDVENIDDDIVWDAFQHWNDMTALDLFARRMLRRWKSSVVITDRYPERFESNADVAIGCGLTNIRVHRNGCPRVTFIDLNTRDPKCMSNSDHMVTVIRHEVGHVLGLGHSAWEMDLMARRTAWWKWAHPVDAAKHEIRFVRKLYGQGDVTWKRQ
jgi:hypothetical protein